MRVIHIIPTAFNYFDNIKKFVFSIVEIQNELGFEVDAITLQYSGQDVAFKRNELKQKKEEAIKKQKLGEKVELPKYGYQGSRDLFTTIQNLDKYDVVNLHVPFLGAGKLILNWKKNNPGVLFVVSYYYDFKILDLFGVLIKFYNLYFLPKIINIADVVTCVESNSFIRSATFKMLKNKDKLFSLIETEDLDYLQLTNSNFGVKLSNKKIQQDIAESLLSIYNIFIKNN